jgi:hypothetical protein
MAFETRLFFGRPGRLAALRSPRGSVAANRQRRISTFELGIGGSAVDQMTGGSRMIVISYEQLTREDWATLEAFAQGHEGPGPFALLDPGQRNRLPANMAGATSVTNDTDNFTIAGSGCTIASSSTYSDAGPRTLAWTFSNASPGASAALTPDWPSSVFPYGVPAVVGQSVTFSAYVRGGGTDVVVTYTPQVIYKDVSGTVLSTTSGTPVASASGAFAQMFATAVAPASTAYVSWKIAYTSGAASSATETFESGVGAWTPTGGSFTSSAVQKHSGTLSGLFTVSGSPTQAYVRQATQIPVTAGVSHTGSMWCYSTAGYALVGAVIDWFDSGGVYLSSSSSGDVALPAATWTQRTVTATAPTGAASAIFGPTLSGSPPNGTALYLDDVSLLTATSVGYFRRFMLNEGTTPDTTWMPGTGVWPVRFGELPDAWPYLSPELRERPSVALIEDVT